MGLTKSDQDWEAESDARTLADAEEIRMDSARKERAIEAAKKLARDAQKNVSRIQHGKDSSDGAGFESGEIDV